MRRFTADDIAKLRLMAQCGHSGTGIARALNRTPQSVRVKACELGIRLRPPSIQHRRIKVPLETFQCLKAEALRLGTSPGRLARLLIETIVRDSLIHAVIDSPPPKPRPTATRRDEKWSAALNRESNPMTGAQRGL